MLEFTDWNLSAVVLIENFENFLDVWILDEEDSIGSDGDELGKGDFGSFETAEE